MKVMHKLGHRSQFGEAQKNLNKKFKRFYQFGFTGTPIFPQNALGAETTAGVFGRELHSYVITDAIRDENPIRKNSPNSLVNTCGLKTSCKTMTSLPV